MALGRYLAADHIQGAQYVEFPGDFHLSWVGHDAHVIGEIEGFHYRGPDAPEIDRVLKTVLSTDISIRPSAPPSSVIVNGGECSARTTSRCVASYIDSTEGEIKHHRRWLSRSRSTG